MLAAHAGGPELDFQKLSKNARHGDVCQELDSQKPSKNARHGDMCQRRRDENKRILVFAGQPAYPTL